MVLKDIGLYWTRWGCKLWMVLICLITLSVMGACAPKKVIRQPDGTLVAEKREKPKAQPQVDEDEDAPFPENPFLPDPGHRGRSGIPQVRSTPDRLILGVKAAELAQQQQGKPYQWGAAGPDKFDCSGLVQYVYGSLGINLPRVSHQQALIGAQIPRNELQPGDLLFFATEGRNVNHVAIYLGHNKFVHAPRRHMPVRTDNLNNAWWRQRYQGARRVE